MSGRIQAVIFDLDGVLVESEQVWDAARRRLTEASGVRWSESATQDMMGMSSTEWSRYMHEELCVKMPPEEILAAVVERMEELYREHLPLIPGARETVERVAALRKQMRLLLEIVERRDDLHPEDLARVRTVSSAETDPADHGRASPYYDDARPSAPIDKGGF